MALLIPQSFVDKGVSLRQFARLAADELAVETLLRTVETSVIVTALTLAIGYPVAYLIAQVRARTAMILMAVIVMSFWISILVRTYSWMVLLQRFGLVNQTLMALGVLNQPIRLMYNQVAVSVGMVHILLPFVILPIYASLKAIDSNLVAAAVTLGATPTQTFLRVTLPLSLNGVAAGVLLVFVQGLGFYVTPMLLGGPQTLMVSSLIDRQMFSYLDWQYGSAISLVLLFCTVVFMLAFDRFFGLETLHRRTA
ncbi:MAG TPA: ABC transporter permease [Sedimentisphaerales bacterium]|nr:ABC transporter permease [Sedimentisphaerales bacterium]